METFSLKSQVPSNPDAAFAASTGSCSPIEVAYSRLKKQAAKFELVLKTTSDRTSEQTETITPALRLGILHNIVSICEALEEAENTGIDPWNDAEFTALHFRKSGLKLPKEFLDQVQHGDVIEAYNFENIQIFRNMSFMEICGYSLVDILSFPWFDLFERSQIITSEIMGQIGKAVIQPKTVQLKIPEHYMKERFSSTKQIVKLRLKNVAPIFADSTKIASAVGFIVSCEASLIKE